MSPPVTAKQEVAQLLTQLPDDATLEDIQYHVYVLEKIKRGQADVAASKSFTTEQARERLSQWLPHGSGIYELGAEQTEILAVLHGRRLLESTSDRFEECPAEETINPICHARARRKVARRSVHQV